MLLFLKFSMGEPVNKLSEQQQQLFLHEINALRTKGCQCGSEYMPPVQALEWDRLLSNSALTHAFHMEENNHFSHRSREGLTIGERLDKMGYRWHYAGENIAMGQSSFEEVLSDWLESPSHCKMLMNPRMRESGLSWYGDYWVQHFGTLMPDNARRTKIYYREG